MPTKIPQTYWPRTTFPQRRLMIEIYKETARITLACRIANVCYNTFRLWYSRYLQNKEEGIKQSPPRQGWYHPRTTPLHLAQRIIELYKEHPEWGKESIANYIRKEHNWQPVISPNGVKKVLEREGLWKKLVNPPKKKSKAVHADEPGKTVNVDLFFLPTQHLPLEPKGEEQESQPREQSFTTLQNKDSFAGQAFLNSNLTYDEKMSLYVSLRQDQQESSSKKEEDKLEAKAQRRQAQAELRSELEQLRIQRRKERLERRRQNQQWKAFRKAHKEQKETYKKLSRKEKRACHPLKKLQDQLRKEKKEQRSQELKQYKQENHTWHTKLAHIKESQRELCGIPILRVAWLAVLLITDNCTRKIISLPLFTAGKEVTAEMVITAMRQVLPSDLHYLISDNGSQFTSVLMAQLAQQLNFIHVRIKPRRPRTNGIAERAVRTVKELIFKNRWEDSEQLKELLHKTLEFFNDRPHQGEELKGLSPNEFERWLLKKISV